MNLRDEIIKSEGEAAVGVYVPNAEEPGWIRCYWGSEKQKAKLVKVLELKNEAFSVHALDDVLSNKLLQDCPAHARMGDHRYVFNFEDYILDSSSVKPGTDFQYDLESYLKEHWHSQDLSDTVIHIMDDLECDISEDDFCRKYETYFDNGREVYAGMLKLLGC